MKEKTIRFKKEELFLRVRQYKNNDNIAILAYTEEDLYGDITINLSGYSIDKDEGFINSITKDSGLEQKLIKEGIIEEVITTVNHKKGKYDMVVFNIEKLKEYDPVGVEKYQKTKENEEEFE